MNIAEEMVRKLVLQARAYDSKETIEDYERDPDSGETDAVETLQTGDNDPIRSELEDWIDSLDEEARPNSSRSTGSAVAIMTARTSPTPCARRAPAVPVRPRNTCSARRCWATSWRSAWMR